MSTPSSTLSRPQSTLTPSQGARATATPPSCKVESMKLLYSADQQVKFLHLQAEVESLMIELQTIKQQRGINASSDIHPHTTCDNN